MCRHLAWLGQPRTLAELVLEPEHGLLVQSYRPRRQRNGTMNADGWGVGYYPPAGSAPARWRSDRPLWSDASFQSIAPTIRSGAVLAAVRSATVGMPNDESACAPFLSGQWLLSHNGVMDRTVLGPRQGAESVCDAAQVAAYVFSRDPADVGKIVADLGVRDPKARLNLLLTDGERILATTWGDTLCTLRTADGVVVASEPFDDNPNWTDVPDHCLVDVTGLQITITNLEP
ncbi:MAG: ergothioneine biosynthesis protein EgtC [Actinomycetota bacterium]|nr:ergothioneine biosynthesis protein EgtC [Actinomycetota bacterium]